VELRELSHLQPYPCARQSLVPMDPDQATITERMDQQLPMGDHGLQRLLRDRRTTRLHTTM
jgi:hypothetical protein